MRKPMAYITAAWSNNEFEVTETAANYCRKLYEAGYTPYFCVTECRRSIRMELIWQGICFAVQECLWYAAVLLMKM